ncbi:lactococcin 972 family bacteriocin [Leucobacter denitrificans]|uniref:Lactococcin 972 family bacteriocin n=1 Tax=Leucobacter denitrificans TaxID=683042 RepID=A0A7G9S2R7_9MICO|nr:lactococcin 972 family bacteriocin [Leucobacter denitrificans]QNN62142.1 lactococcin 972 family bacteriocin [Leucobacter denitrificans]
MKTSRKFLSAAALAAAVLLATPMAANAVTVSKGGGTWTYSAEAKNLYSQYQHHSRTHKATVENLSQRHSSGWRPKGVLATAALSASLFGNKAYWDVI